MEQLTSIKPSPRMATATSRTYGKSVKEISYNQYILFDELSMLWGKNLSREESILQAGFISIELTARLIGSTIESTREQDNKNEIINSLTKSLLKQLDLLLSVNLEGLSWSKITSNIPSYSINIENLRLLDDQYFPFIEAFTTRYNLLSKKAGIEIGLGKQMNAIRCQSGLAPLSIDCTRQLDYQIIVPSYRIGRLRSNDRFNIEDEIFMTIHQISECWLYVAIEELHAIMEQFSKKYGTDQDCSQHFSFASSILQYVGQNILALERLCLSDYYLLRVARRGASGGQSQQAHNIWGLTTEIYKLFMHHVKEEEISILTILEHPTVFNSYSSVINSMTVLERSLQNFYFQHSRLSCSVISSQSFNSINLDLATLSQN